jgi:hypothetical protein
MKVRQSNCRTFITIGKEQTVKDLSRFATEDWPLHPSGMRGLLMCPWRIVAKYLADTAVDEPPGPAADTGSAAHAAVAAMHRGASVADALSVMGGRLPDYPQADLNDAAALFLAYATDPRNSSARVVLVEHPITFQISPAEEDKTQAPISVVGTLDQVREEDGKLRIWDFKTSKLDPIALLNNHALQVAAYCVGASIALQRPVDPGGLILPRRYGKGATHWMYPWTLADAEHLVEGIRHAVAAVRNGHVWHTPGEGCTWCWMRTPDTCLPKLQQLKRTSLKTVCI